ncbi:hypothetical protein HRG_007341 [Hirsutella rhossiliensis]|uniref:MARVEL domain-containing protein n=1 Tax=Hirsutella rhossiliensis TaxID=111463 RepID=A0A9P8SFT6_9HYPO|nr:uncharacterized protein HRG_07341 [Hirsutella rhossiliensis]KAH0961263.1 hypothetical protein HRG_07341 [Hirsutella rhossiliensis]
MEQPSQEPVSGHVLASPTLLFALRIAQAVLALIVLALASVVASGLYFNELGLALAMPIITCIVVAYALVTEKVPSCHAAYRIVAVLALDAVLVVLWLATFAAVAAMRALLGNVPDMPAYNWPNSGCVYNSGNFNLNNCLVNRAIPLQINRHMISAVAGLGALVWVLHIVTFVWTLLAFLRLRKAARFHFNTNTATSTANCQIEPKVEQRQPVGLNQQQ